MIGAILSTGCAGLLGIDEGTLADGGGDATTDASTGDGAAEGAVDGGSDVAIVEGGCGDFTFASGNGACQTCLETSCCADLTACAGVASCVTFAGCLFACADGDEACVGACENRAQNSAPRDQLLACRASQCASACETKCGGRPTFPSATCQSCAEVSCCDTQTACFDDADCVEILSCSCAQGDVGCLSACESRHSAGTTHYAAYASCLQSSCASQCPGASQWTCVGAHAPPIAPIPGKPIDVSLALTSLLNPGTPFDATAAACSAVDITCATPLASASTDAMGLLSFTLTPSGAGFGGYFQLSGTSVHPSLLYAVDPPIVDDGAVIAAFAFTDEDFTALGSQTSTTIDPTRGAVLASIVGCDGAPGNAVSFSVSNADASSKSFYVAKGTATTAQSMTDPLGVGGVLNVPASGGVVVTATIGKGATTVAQQQVMVRAGMLTIVKLSP